jgi:predicted integral membrane protein DUF2269
MLRNFLLTLHVFGAIVGFGPTFAFPFIGALAQKPGAPIPWLLKLTDKISSRLTETVAATVQPGTGAGLIIISRGAYDPFNWSDPNSGLWLFIALILYTISFSFAIFVQARRSKKAIQMAEAQQFGPEFGGLMKKLAMGGQFLTVMLVAIIILMVVKPGR